MLPPIYAARLTALAFGMGGEGEGGAELCVRPAAACVRAERMRNIAEFIGVVEEVEGTITVMDYMQFLEVPSE